MIKGRDRNGATTINESTMTTRKKYFNDRERERERERNFRRDDDRILHNFSDEALRLNETVHTYAHSSRYAQAIT